eukprot:2853129-Rhodomonas_salina.1
MVQISYGTVADAEERAPRQNINKQDVLVKYAMLKWEEAEEVLRHGITFGAQELAGHSMGQKPDDGGAPALFSVAIA